jgi:Tfp pilus assembly PilM family ATPase
MEKIIKQMLSKSRSKRRYSDLVGIDFANSATKVVRLKQMGSEVSLAGIDMLPAVDFDSSSARIELPRNMTTYYSCLSYSRPEAVVRLVNTPLAADEENLPDSKLRELLSVEEEFRVSSRLIKRGKGRQDSSLLAVAIPQDDVGFMLNMFPSGPPAPASLEISGLSFISAFLHARGAECANEAVCLIESGELSSTYIFLNKGTVVLIGKMNFGSRALLARLGEDLGVDDELAGSILNDRSINISSSLNSVLEPFLKQVSISKDFIERHQGCRIEKLYVSGGLSLLPSWSDEVGQMLHLNAVSWNPLENISVEPDILSPELEFEITRFSSAIGAALGGFEEQ